MSALRPLAAALCAAAAAAGAGAATPDPHVPRDPTLIVTVPSLGTLSRQAAELLSAAATFPGGDELLDGRAVLARRLGFDLFDAATMKAAGLDPKGSASVTLRMTSADEVEGVFSLPVADAARFRAALRRLAREQFQLEAPRVKPGAPAVTVWPAPEGERAELAAAVSRATALVAFGAGAEDEVRAAVAARRAPAKVSAAYRTVSRALGGELALIAYAPPGSRLSRDAPALAHGFGVGLAAGKDRLRVPLAVIVDERSPLARAARADTGPMVGKLDPDAAVVWRSAADLRAAFTRDDVALLLGRRRASERVGQLLLDLVGALGGGMAMGIGAVSLPPELDAPPLRSAPLTFFRSEVVLGLSDPARARAALRDLVAEAVRPQDRVELAAEGPWLLPAPGGELGVAVEGTNLLVALGPTGCLQELTQRTGTTFRPPTPAAARAFAAPLSAMVIDCAALAAGLRALPEDALRNAPDAQRAIQQLAEVLDRIRAISFAGDLAGNVHRAEILVELRPRPPRE
jgi:hypothetical protein